MLRAFLRAPSGVLSLIVIVVLALVALIAPETFGEVARRSDVIHANQTSSPAHWFGTDGLGRDILLRVLVATRLSLGAALSATLLGAVIGIPLGAVAAVLGPRIRPLALRTIDTLLAFPGLIVAIFVGAVIGPGVVGATMGVGVAMSFSFARVASTLALSIGAREFVLAARVTGVGGLRLLLRYVLPNIAETFCVTTTVAVSSSVAAVSSLSFLGLGVQPPDYDWGRMLTEGVRAFYGQPAAALAPAVAIGITALAFGFLGEALARALNPLLWTVSKGRGAPLLAARAPLAPSPRTDLSATPRTGEVLLAVEDLRVTFRGPHSSITVVDGVSFVVRRGEMVGIVGESGSGKTITSLAITQLVPYPGVVTGSIKLKGEDVASFSPARLAHEMAVVFQDPMSSLNPALRIGVQVTEGVRTHRRLERRAAFDLAMARLGEVNLPTPVQQLARYPHELSGGMRQRVMIAMGLMNEPSLLIADEPTTALDVTIQAQILELLTRLNTERHMAVILISHNLGLVSGYCHRVLVMYAGRVVEELSREQLLAGPRHPYTRALLNAVPDMKRPRELPLDSIAGQPPDMAMLPQGCAYQPRCPLAVERCAHDVPPLLEHPDGQRVACWVAGEALAKEQQKVLA